MANLTTPIEKAKLKIKETINTPVDIEKEVDLPYYFKINEFSFFKIISDTEAVWVSSFPDCIKIEVKKSVSHFLDNDKPITKEEFNTAFQTALTKIQNL